LETFDPEVGAGEGQLYAALVHRPEQTGEIYLAIIRFLVVFRGKLQEGTRRTIALKGKYCNLDVHWCSNVLRI
jgi:hypothetical protein